MTRRARYAVLAMAVAATIFSAPAAAAGDARCGRFAQAPREATDHELRTSVLCLVNLARERHGRAPLRFSRPLRNAATGHSRSMVRSGALTHYGPSGSTVAGRVARSGYLRGASSFRLAENIAAGKGRGRGSPRAIVRGWMRSAGHRQNILDGGLREFGAGVARGNAPTGRGRGNAAAYTLVFGVRH